MNKTIMILGAGLMQLPAFETARERGWYIVACDGDKNAICKSRADRFLHIDLKDRIGLAEAGQEIMSERGLDGVFTCGTDFSTSVAWVAQQLGLPGISHQTALDCTDKVRMRTRFKEGGVPSPAFEEISEDMDFLSVCKTLILPLVVKPVDNMGGRGVIRVNDWADLQAAGDEAIRYSRSGRAIVEEFIDGPEFSIDSLVIDGEVHITGFADRHIYYPPYFIEMGHTLPTKLLKKDQAEVISVFSHAVKTLGITNGVAKGDIKWSSRGVMIGEIAARLSGGYMSGWTYPYATGVNLVEKGMCIAMGEDIGSLTPPLKRVSAERAFLSIPGKIKKIHYLEESHEQKDVKDIFLRLDDGDEVEFPINNVTKCGNVLVSSATRAGAIKSSENAVATILVELEAENSETSNFLNQALDTSFPPSAYAWREFGDHCFDFLEDFKPDFSKQYKVSPIYFPDKELNKKGLKDWNHRSLVKSKKLLQDHTKLKFSKDIRGSEFEKHFWYALVRGGVQGALWYSAQYETL